MRASLSCLKQFASLNPWNGDDDHDHGNDDDKHDDHGDDDELQLT